MTWLLLLACSGEGDTAAADDTGLCGTAPIVTWETFGAGFVTENCQTCHASTAPNRYDAPEEVTFDTVDRVWALRDRVLARVVEAVEDEDTGTTLMPPMGGTSEDDRYLLEVWLSCAEAGT